MTTSKSNISPLPRKQATRFKFTVNRVNDLKPRAGAYQVYDSTVQGLAVRVTPKGAKSFVFFRKLSGKTIRLKLGAVGGLSLADARAAAQQMNGKAATGVDVLKERKDSARAQSSLNDLFGEWYEASKHLKSREADKRRWNNHLEVLGRKRAGDVTRADLQRVVDKVGANYPRMANLCAALLSRVYSHAIRNEVFEGRNPAKLIKRFPEHSRERYLLTDEMPRFLDAVNKEESPWREYFLLLLHTGQRYASVCAMRWDDIDISAGVWNLPAWKSKNGKALSIALTSQAVVVLEGIAEPDERKGWVFRSDMSESGHITSPNKAWNRICERADLENLNIHDVRRTVGSYLAAAGASNFVISKALGHTNLKSAEVYARMNTNPVRDALEGLLGAVTKESKA